MELAGLQDALGALGYLSEPPAARSVVKPNEKRGQASCRWAPAVLVPMVGACLLDRPSGKDECRCIIPGLHHAWLRDYNYVGAVVSQALNEITLQPAETVPKAPK